MATLSPTIAARARKNFTAMLSALASVSQVRVAELLGVDASTVSRWKESELERFAAFLAATDQKVVPSDSPTVAPDILKAMAKMAELGARRAGEPSSFGNLDSLD